MEYSRVIRESSVLVSYTCQPGIVVTQYFLTRLDDRLYVCEWEFNANTGLRRIDARIESEELDRIFAKTALDEDHQKPTEEYDLALVQSRTVVRYIDNDDDREVMDDVFLMVSQKHKENPVYDNYLSQNDYCILQFKYEKNVYGKYTEKL